MEKSYCPTCGNRLTLDEGRGCLNCASPTRGTHAPVPTPPPVPQTPRVGTRTRTRRSRRR